MPKRVQHEAFLSLAEVSRWDLALEMLELGLNMVHGQHEWMIWYRALEVLPEAVLLGSVRYCRSKARVLRGCREAKLQLAFTSLALEHHSNDLGLQVEQAWALNILKEPRLAYHQLEALIPDCETTYLGLAWRVFAGCEHALGLDARASFERARVFLSGRDLGLCFLEQASTLGDGSDTRALYAQASALLTRDAFHLAWLNHNWGMYELRVEGLAGEAETRLLESVRLARTATATSFLPRALCGLGAFYRFKRELERADSAYREALRFAKEDDDREQSLWGLAQTLRLNNQAGKALESLERALLIRGSDWLQPSLAAALIGMNALEEARDHLRGHWTGITLDRARIAQAELDRLDQQHVLVLQGLLAIDWKSPALLEELFSYPKLLALAIALELPVQSPPPVTATRVLVKNLGPLEVFVNDRKIALHPTGRVAEVLGYLIEHDHAATCRELALALWSDLDPADVQRKAKTINEHVRALRRALGWQGSVRSDGITYSLDPNAIWTHDAATLKNQARLRYQQYLSGIHSNWAVEAEQDLNALLEELPAVERDALKVKAVG
jgi:tetratricopeptide (TPR) repeat protein